MKRGILLISIIFLYGCSYGLDSDSNCQDLNSLCEYVNSQIDYISDYDSVYETKEYFQSPMETDYLKTGDCEDFSIYFMYLAKQEFDIELDFVVLWIDNMGYHAMTKYDGVYYCPTNLFIADVLPDRMHPVFSVGYDEIMIYSTRFFTKGIK